MKDLISVKAQTFLIINFWLQPSFSQIWFPTVSQASEEGTPRGQEQVFLLAAALVIIHAGKTMSQASPTKNKQLNHLETVTTSPTKRNKKIW